MESQPLMWYVVSLWSILRVPSQIDDCINATQVKFHSINQIINNRLFLKYSLCTQYNIQMDKVILLISYH